jgi:hypothetical protein
MCVVAWRRYSGTMSSDKIVRALLLLLERPTCAGCVSTKLGVADAEVSPLLTRVHDTVYVNSSTGVCRACGDETVIYSMGCWD